MKVQRLFVRTKSGLIIGLFLGLWQRSQGFVSSNNAATKTTLRVASSTSSSVSSHDDITSSLISQLAVVALKLRLAAQRGVACEVKAANILGGQVGPVTVKGRGWRSPRGLTCRAIEATFETCELDMRRVVSSQKLVLSTPADGRAMVAFNSEDFGNFITHPLLSTMASDSNIQFVKDGVTVDPEIGAVTFFCSHGGEKWHCCLQRAKDAVAEGGVCAVVVEPTSEEHLVRAQALTKEVSQFFNDMVVELDGTYLKFRDMMVTAKGANPSVMLALDIVMKKFPSPGAPF